jgi:hypothetical protein
VVIATKTAGVTISVTGGHFFYNQGDFLLENSNKGDFATKMHKRPEAEYCNFEFLTLRIALWAAYFLCGW